MKDRLSVMLEKYSLDSETDYINALKEIIQEIALLGLWREKFFDHAAFYGGTALRILYGLDRFSEDLDFSLLIPNNSFSLESYNKAVEIELRSFGFETTVKSKIKTKDTRISSAFIKAGRKKQLLTINVPDTIINKFHHMHTIKVKMEIDIDPPGNFQTETKEILLPIPFVVTSYQMPDLFAGKIHAVLCRSWELRVKGRDWYDLVWYIGRKIPVRILHLEQRLIQSGHWNPTARFSTQDLYKMLHDKIDKIDIESAKNEVSRFIKDADSTRNCGYYSSRMRLFIVEQISLKYCSNKPNAFF
jgi:predicted nucleotidyltransferase component of viral defense system